MNIDQIIGKLMGDGSVGEEKSALDAWKKEAEENAKALEEIQKIATFSSTLNGYKDFNTDSAWESFADNLIVDNEPAQKSLNIKVIDKQRTASIFSLKNLARIAAIAIVVAGSIFLFNLFLNPSNNIDLEPTSYSSTVEMMNFDLKDGTKVTLDKNSDLKILNERDVALIGRAHFDVERDESKQFTIDLPVGNVTVLGTEFTIDADDKTTEVFVEEGSVRYQLGTRTWTLVAGDLVKVADNDAVVIKGNVNYDSWKNQRLIFRDNNMVEVVDALSRHFKKDIIIENEKNFSNCNVMNVFTDFTLNDILNGLSKTHGLKFELRENKVYIVAAKC